VIDLLLIAASGLAREIISADQSVYRVVGILDDDPSLRGSRLAGVEIIGDINDAANSDAKLLVCVGSGITRRRIVSRLASLHVGVDRYATFVDRSNRVPASCCVGVGSILLAGVVLTADVLVGRHVVLMPHVVLTHDNSISDFATLASGVSLGGAVAVAEAAYIGMNASARQGVRIGSESIVGMGAAVISDVPSGETWVGVPARCVEHHESQVAT
jgi:sugar O-acyltransferase (sialic acid O-acetyltransferase NeuD family)